MSDRPPEDQAVWDRHPDIPQDALDVEYGDPWRQITCLEREALIDSLGRSYNGFNDASGVKVLAAFTDPESYIFTEWGYDYARPVLRDERWPNSDRDCAHHVPEPHEPA